MSVKPQVAIIGGGMITRTQVLPCVYQLQRLGRVGQIHVCGQRSATLQGLADDDVLREAFAKQTFTPHPPLDADAGQVCPELYREVLADLPAQSIVVIATPDQLHYAMLQAAIENGHHICCVKPLVLEAKQGREIAGSAYEKGLVVGIEYHKRFDDRNRMARRLYRQKAFGEFRLGQAVLHEPWYYRHSNFQNWCTCANSDMFTYIACHYIDLVHFITGLMPTGVSVYGIKDRYPNGNEGYLWTDGRVLWENGACLNVQNALGYPDGGPGGNMQGMCLHFQDGDSGAMLLHNDQHRGVEHVYIKDGKDGCDKISAQPNPDYFQYVDADGEGLQPVGYGYRSMEYIVGNICRCIEAGAEASETQGLSIRQEITRRYDEEGIMATPANSAYNELVVEAGRLSLLNQGREVEISYGENPGVRLRTFTS